MASEPRHPLSHPIASHLAPPCLWNHQTKRHNLCAILSILSSHSRDAKMAAVATVCCWVKAICSISIGHISATKRYRDLILVSLEAFLSPYSKSEMTAAVELSVAIQNAFDTFCLSYFSNHKRKRCDFGWKRIVLEHRNNVNCHPHCWEEILFSFCNHSF